MSTLQRFVFILSALIGLQSAALAQHSESTHQATHTEGHVPFRPHHTLSLVLSHAQVSKGRDMKGGAKYLSLPSWGIDHTWQFHPKWGIGIHTDIITETFEVEKHLDGGHADEVIERKLPIAPALMGVYMPNHHWGFLFGAGVELERNEHFFLNRMGVEYAASISRGWEVIGTLSYDVKWKGYDTWILGVGISKILGNHK